MPRWSATSARAWRCWPTGSKASSATASALLALREEILARIADRADEDRFPLTPQRIVHDVRQVMPEDGIVALDNGMYKIWFARNYRTACRQHAAARQRAGDDGRRAAVGDDGGACSIRSGACMAVCGDGGFMMNSRSWRRRSG